MDPRGARNRDGVPLAKAPWDGVPCRCAGFNGRESRSPVGSSRSRSGWGAAGFRRWLGGRPRAQQLGLARVRGRQGTWDAVCTGVRVRSVWKHEPGGLDGPLRPGERSRDCGAGPSWPGGGRALGRPAPEGPPMSLARETSRGVAGSPGPRPSGGGNSESEVPTRVGTPHPRDPRRPWGPGWWLLSFG